MSKRLINEKPMTKKEKNIKYREHDRIWKKENYTSFAFHLPKELVSEFRKTAKENNDIQRQLLIDFMENYIQTKKEPNHND